MEVLEVFSQGFSNTMFFLSLARSPFGEHFPHIYRENVLTSNSGLMGLIPTFFMNKLD